MRTFETRGQPSGRKRSLDAQNHSKQVWWKSESNRNRRGNVRRCVKRRVDFGNLCRRRVWRKSASRTDRCGYVLRPLQEAAAVPILAWLSAGSELKRDRIPGLAKPRTAGMARGHGVLVSGVVLSDFARCMCVPHMHREHRRHGHLCPGHHDHEQRRRNGLLQHPDLVWQARRRLDVTTITPRSDSGQADP